MGYGFGRLALLLEGDGEAQLSARVVRPPGDDVVPHRELAAITLVAADRRGAQGHDGHEEHADLQPSLDYRPAITPTDEERERLMGADGDEHDHGGEGEVHPVLERHVGERVEAGRRGEDEEEPGAPEAQPG